MAEAALFLMVVLAGCVCLALFIKEIQKGKSK